MAGNDWNNRNNPNRNDDDRFDRYDRGDSMRSSDRYNNQDYDNSNFARYRGDDRRGGFYEGTSQSDRTYDPYRYRSDDRMSSSRRGDRDRERREGFGRHQNDIQDRDYGHEFARELDRDMRHDDYSINSGFRTGAEYGGYGRGSDFGSHDRGSDLSYGSSTSARSDDSRNMGFGYGGGGVRDELDYRSDWNRPQSDRNLNDRSSYDRSSSDRNVSRTMDSATASTIGLPMFRSMDRNMDRGSMGRNEVNRGYGMGAGMGQHQMDRSQHSRSDMDRSQQYQSGIPGFERGQPSMGARGPVAFGQYSGRGPKGYRRSDDRVKEEVCDILERHPDIDASEIEVDVKEGMVVLRGSVSDRRQKRMAEDTIESLSGVRDVRNELSVNRGFLERAKEAILGGDSESKDSTVSTSASSSQSTSVTGAPKKTDDASRTTTTTSRH